MEIPLVKRIQQPTESDKKPPQRFQEQNFGQIQYRQEKYRGR